MQTAKSDGVVTTSTRYVAMAMATLLYAGVALAQEDPMGDGMCYFVNMLTGKWVFGASVIGIIATGLTFISGVEMNEFVKKLASAVLVVSLLLAATSIVRAIGMAMGGFTAC